MKDERLEELVMTKLDRRTMKPNNFEILGNSFIEAGNEVGSSIQYGNKFKKINQMSFKNYVRKRFDQGWRS